MKKIIISSLCLFILITFSGCYKNNFTSNTNKLSPYKLSKSEETIAKLISGQDNYDIFNFKVDKEIKSLTIWLEGYHNGEKINMNPEANFPINNGNGKISINSDMSEKYKWSFVIGNDEAIASYSFKTNNDFETDSKYSKGSTKLSDPIEIVNNKDIILEAYPFKSGNTMSIYNPNEYMDDPDLLKEFDYIYLVKCRFSDKSSNNIILE